MVKLSRIVKDYRESGAVNSFVNVHGFIDEHVLLTKSGDLAVVLKVEPRDSECLEPADLADAARRFEASLRGFDPLFRINQYTIKRSGAKTPPHAPNPDAVVEQALRTREQHLDSRANEHYTTDSCIVIVYEGSRSERLAFRNPFSALRGAFSTSKTTESIDAAINRGAEILRNRVNGFVVQLRGEVNLSVATKQEAFRALRRLLNFDRTKADSVELQYDQFVDYFLCGSAIECHRDHLRVDDYHVKILTLKDLPAKTYANMLRPLQDLASQYVIATQFVPVDNAQMRKLIKRCQRHAHNSRTSLISNLNTQNGPTTPGDQLVDKSKDVLVDELGDCLTALELKGSSFGLFTLTVILYDKDRRRLDKSVADAFKSLAAQGATLHQETYNSLNAFMATLPANSRFNLRSLYLPTACYADLSVLFAPHSGEQIDAHLRAECLATFETRQNSLYSLSLHHHDLAHTVIFGPTGSGKSFLANFTLTHAQKYAPRMMILDLGGSYEMLTQLFGGSYLRIGDKQRDFTINPFSLEPTPGNRQFLFTFVKLLIELSGTFTMSDQDERELFAQIGSLYLIDPSQRRLTTLLHILPKHLEQYLRRWTEGGQYGDVFDNEVDTLTFSRFQTFDFAGMDEYPQILEPFLLYILHRASAEISDPSSLATFKICMIDEAWRFFRNATVKQYIVEALKTWRKCNAAMMLATQSAVDLTDNGLLQVVADSAATLVFLANSRLDRSQYRDAFRLNETELDLIADLTPKKQMLIKRPDLSKVVELQVSARDYWLFTNNAMDNDLKRRVFAEHGFEQGLDYLATQRRAIDSPLSEQPTERTKQ